MHDNAIHDLALACWSVLLSPIKRPAIQTNRTYSGKLSAIGSGTARYSLRRHFWLRLLLVFIAADVIEHSTANQNLYISLFGTINPEVWGIIPDLSI